jgi:beta-hydroxyacyl-[acyl carrier protein] dehydratase FabZ
LIHLDIHEVLEHLPHRYPFLLIDRVVSCEPGISLVAIKNVTINEPFFTGHFPQRPVMPGVLILEAMAQASGILAFASAQVRPQNTALFYLVGIDKARFKRPVEPGDQLHIEVHFKRIVRSIWMFAAKTSVDGVRVASAELMCTLKAPEV